MTGASVHTALQRHAGEQQKAHRACTDVSTLQLAATFPSQRMSHPCVPSQSSLLTLGLARRQTAQARTQDYGAIEVAYTFHTNDNVWNCRYFWSYNTRLADRARDDSHVSRRRDNSHLSVREL